VDELPGHEDGEEAQEEQHAFPRQPGMDTLGLEQRQIDKPKEEPEVEWYDLPFAYGHD
jgi:hypothetical protein